MRKLRVLLAVLAVCLLLSSCDGPLREVKVPDGDLKVDVTVELDEPILNTKKPEDTTALDTTAPAETTEAETTGEPETTAPPETTFVPPLVIEPAFTTEPPVTTSPPETLPPEPVAKHPVVLMYHCINDEPNTPNTALFVRPSEFEAHAKAIVDNGIDTLFADEFGEVENTSVILTFDDGYEDNYTYMFPIIKKYNVKVTVFMIAYMIDKPGYLTSEQIKEMSDSGLVEFGSHTLDHPSLTTLDEDAIREQFAGSSWIIYQKTGKPVTSLAYPSGDYNERVMRIAREYYEFAYTTDATSYWGQDPMMLPRYAIYRDHTIHTFRNFVE